MGHPADGTTPLARQVYWVALGFAEQYTCVATGGRMAGCVLLREDDRDLIQLVHELLEDQDYTIVDVVSLEDLLVEATRRGPCVALIDGTHPAGFDLWWLGPVLSKLGVPAIAFTAHASAQEQFEHDAHGYVGVLTKPFDAGAFIDLVNSICWAHEQQVAS